MKNQTIPGIIRDEIRRQNSSNVQQQSAGSVNNFSYTSMSSPASDVKPVHAHTFNDADIHTGFASFIDQALKTTDNVKFNQIDIGDTGMFKLLSLTVDRTTGGSTVTDKEMWILANAYYNSGDGYFYRVDNTATAFGLQIQGKGTIPGEEAISTVNQGYVIWRCTPNTGTPTDKIGALVGSTWTTFGVYYGWELGFLFDSFRNLVIGGFGIEIDGSGTFPFGRIIHELTSGTGWGQTFTGILTNLYAQINGGQDDPTKPSWFAGIEGDSFRVKRRAAAVNPILYAELIDLLTLSNAGILTLKNPAGASQISCYSTDPDTLASYQFIFGVSLLQNAIFMGGVTDHKFQIRTNNTTRVTILNTTGNAGFGVATPTAVVHLKAGTATAGSAPLKLTSGTLNTTAEVGALEFLTDKLYTTITTGAARKEIAIVDATLTSGKIPVATTNGRLTDLTAQAHEADAKTDYTTGDLDTEAKIITELNATNTKLNAIIAKLESLKLFASS